MDEGCRVDDAPTNDGLLLHGCDAVSGDSGSPILGITDDALVIVGVHVATGRRQVGESIGIAIPVESISGGVQRRP